MPAEPPNTKRPARDPDRRGVLQPALDVSAASEPTTGLPGDVLWRDPAYAVSGLLHIISASLGGDLVVWTSVDDATGVVTVIGLVDPDTSSETLSDLLQRSGALAPHALSSRVAEFGRSVLVPSLAVADYSMDAFPDPWPEYLAAHPIHSLIAVPIRLDAAVTGVLIVARHTAAQPYTADDLRLVESGAHRLVGRTPSASDAGDKAAVARVVVRWLTRQRRRIKVQELLLGTCPPVLTAAALWSLDDYEKYRPGVLFLLGCVVAAMVAGVRAAALSGVLGSLALWWAFTPPERSWDIASRGDAVRLPPLRRRCLRCRAVGVPARGGARVRTPGTSAQRDAARSNHRSRWPCSTTSSGTNASTSRWLT